MTKGKKEEKYTEEKLQEDIAHTGNPVGPEGELKPVDQGIPAEELPTLQDSVSIAIPENVVAAAETKKKGKPAKPNKELAELKEKTTCGFCANPMLMSDGVNVIEIKGKKPPKDLDGNYRWTSPSVAEGKVAGVICDTCKAQASNPTTQKQDGSGSYIDLKFAIAVYPDSTVRNIPVNML